MIQVPDLKDALLNPEDLLLGGALVDKDAAPPALFRLAELPRAVFDPRQLIAAGACEEDAASSMKEDV